MACFKLGRYYQHSNKQIIHIIAVVNTFFYGEGLLAEDSFGNLKRVGADEASAYNWHEVSGWNRSTYSNNAIPEPDELDRYTGLRKVRQKGYRESAEGRRVFKQQIRKEYQGQIIRAFDKVFYEERSDLDVKNELRKAIQSVEP